MRILFNAWRDTSHPLAGGSEVMIDRLATGLLDRGHHVDLRAGGPVTGHPYEVRNGGGKFDQYLRSPAHYRRHYRDHDVVVDVANGMSFYTPLWRTGPTVCLVHHVHTDQWRQWFPAPVAAFGRTLEKRAMPAVYRSCLYVAVSDSTSEALVDLGVDPARIRVVPNGVDLPETEPGAEDPEPLFLALGRLVPHKRYDLMLRVWKRVHPITGGRLVIVGDGPEEERLHAMHAPAVEFRGRVSDAERDELLDRAWLLVHPSMLEGWGLVVMEAAARNTPTLGFNVPGVRDSVVHTETGLLARSEAEFADYWTDLALGDDLRHKLGRGALDRAHEYSWEATVARFEDVMEEAAADHPLPPRRGRARQVAQPDPVTDHGVDPDAAPLEDPAVSPAPDVATKVELFRLFLREKHDPDPFYSALATRSIRDFRHPVEDRLVLDLGCGHGYDTRALRDAGAKVVPVDLDAAKLTATGALLDGAMQGDATNLPFPDDSFDGIYCSNLIEHCPDTVGIFREIHRVLKPGGWAWVSWTNWYSPWGGHEIVPLHYLGPRLGYRTWVRLKGVPRVNVPYDGLWPTYIGRTLEIVRDQPGLALVDATPRYYPSQRWILKVPGVREVLTWNCVLDLQKLPDTK